jgi:uroporphyrinogen decarboxylase
LQGNFDPILLTTDDTTIRRAVADAWRDFDPHYRYIANLGHGITPDASPTLVAEFVAVLRSAQTT